MIRRFYDNGIGLDHDGKKYRHVCAYCSRKRNYDKMILLYSKLLRREGWICKDHVSYRGDIICDILYS